MIVKRIIIPQNEKTPLQLFSFKSKCQFYIFLFILLTATCLQYLIQRYYMVRSVYIQFVYAAGYQVMEMRLSALLKGTVSYPGLGRVM